MISIAGGCYVERCVNPPWDQLFGSGGRAAAALSALDNNVKLTTYIDEKHRPALEALAAIFGFKVDHTTIVTTPSFSYYHGLSHPRIRPDLHRISQAPPLALDNATILRFGMIEGDAVVRGDAVIYNPQNAFNPRPFHENGSSAKRLAVVANYREAKTLAQIRLSDVPTADLGQAILQNHNADVVVIKQGSLEPPLSLRRIKGIYQRFALNECGPSVPVTCLPQSLRTSGVYWSLIPLTLHSLLRLQPPIIVSQLISRFLPT